MGRRSDRVSQLATILTALEGAGRGSDETRGAEAIAALEALRRLREDLATWEPELIASARDAGVSWARIAPALGVTTRQAAERRYLRLRSSPTGERNREDRVRATRDERAGDRAVSRWARDNASQLRQIAGQVSALTDLDPGGQRSARTLRRSLASDDPASLLTPLADMQEHLGGDHHAGLAGQVSALTSKVDGVRRETQRRRARQATIS